MWLPATAAQAVPLDKIESSACEGTLVVYPGVWHCAPFAEKNDFVIAW